MSFARIARGDAIAHHNKRRQQHRVRAQTR